MKTLLNITLLISSILVLTGCSTGVITPDDGQPSMSQAYEAAVNDDTTFTPTTEKGQNTIAMPANNTALPVATVTQNPVGVASTLNSQFPTLPNPQSVMYIFGHYAGDEQLPVPGHFTAFSLYTQIHYALPTEIQRPYNDGQFVSGDNHA